VGRVALRSFWDRGGAALDQRSFSSGANGAIFARKPNGLDEGASLEVSRYYYMMTVMLANC
jgi:hypothetical protein